MGVVWVSLTKFRKEILNWKCEMKFLKTSQWALTLFGTSRDVVQGRSDKREVTKR